MEKMNVCVFGFSRGSATARCFTSENENKRLAQMFKVPPKNVVYKFVGIFDTVSSVFAENLKNVELKGDNVDEFNLAMGNRVQKVVQLTAADEYRNKFALTNIKSSIAAGVGFEFALPGSHCDIGGGYDDNEKEEIEDMVILPQKSKKIQKFIDIGWYSEDDRKRVPIPDSISISACNLYGIPYKIKSLYHKVERTVRAGYNTIPLSIMLHFAKEYGGIKYEETDEKDKSEIPDDLKSLGVDLLKLAIDKEKEKEKNEDEEAPAVKYVSNDIRRKYIHLSAYPENGDKDFVAWLKDSASRKKGYYKKRRQYDG